MSGLNLYKGKKVLLTGHTGFKGTWLLALLHHLGARVKGYALEPEQENAIFNTIRAEDFCEENVIHDIRDRYLLEKEVLAFEPDYIFHLAAQPLVRLSYAIPSETFDVNVQGTAYLLDAVRLLRNKCQVVVVTTDKVYKNKETSLAYKETDALGGYDPYSTSKACAELLVESYRSSFFNRDRYHEHQKSVVTARAGNVIGGGDFSKDRIIPDLIRAFESDQTLNIRHPQAIRPWQHVIEPLVGYLKLGLSMEADYEQVHDAYNFGPKQNDHLSVAELIKIATDVFGKGSYEVLKTDDLHEAGILKLNIDLAQSHLGWKPQYNAGEAIRKTIEWYTDRGDKRTVTQHQIADYLEQIDAI